MVYGTLFLTVFLLGTMQLDLHQIVYEFKGGFLESDYEFMISRLYKETAKLKIRKRIIVTICSFFLSLLLWGEQQNATMLFYAMISAVSVFKFQYVIVKEIYQKNLKEAELVFPHYLNALSILLQNNPVPVAILKSIALSPKIFEQDLNILVQELHQGKKVGVRPYLDFANKFPQIKDLNRIMRSLFNLTVTSTRSGKIMASLTKLANEKVNIVRKEKLDKHLDKQALVPWLSFLWIGFVIIAMFTTINIGQLF